MRLLLLPLLCISVAAPAMGQHPVLNEVMSGNTRTLEDEDGDFSDWIELYNPTDAALSLGGYGLSDDADEPFKWTMPPQTLDAGSHALVFASSKDRPGTSGQWETVIDWGEAWRYRAGTSEPPATWTDVGFDDTGWSVGASGFGYGDGDDATVVSSSVLVYYARTTFTIDDPADVTGALFHVHYDDAFVAYLNGVEIARAGVGVPGTRPTFQDPATTDHEAQNLSGALPAEFALERPGELLRAGENVLAVQVHNVSTTSSDLTLIPFLSLSFSTPPDAPRGASAHLTAVFERPPHTNFKLSSDGESLYLTSPDETYVDAVSFPALPPDVSYGRAPDGSDTWALFNAPTPQSANASGGASDVAAPPAFDRPPGFYPTSISVQLEAAMPGTPIHYTLDGSEPTAKSSRYTGPLTFSRTTVVRARALPEGQLPSEIVTHTYLINQLQHLPTISITTPPVNLWDWETGIYVLGPNASPEAPNEGANFWQDWEIPVHVAFFETDGELAFSTDAGARIFGGWTRSFDQKSLAIFARGRYGDSAFEHPIFPDRPYDSYQAFVLRNAGNDWVRAHFRDGFMQNLAADTEVDRLAFRPAVVYLNGEYWGIHNLREKLNEHYLASLHNLDADELDLLELNGSVIQGDNADYLALLDFMANSDMTSPDVYAEVQRQIDLDNFIDYQLAQIFFNNRDWPGNNIKFWRPHAEDGKWRWILYDTDFGFNLYGAFEYQDNGITFATASNGPEWPNPPWSTFLLRRLLQNPDFERAFINRLADLLNVHFRLERMEAILHGIVDVMDDEMPRHTARWGQQGGTWSAQIETIRTFARERQGVLLRHWQTYFGLADPAPVTLDLATSEGGTIRINREVAASYPWTGNYFPGVPVTVTAQPAPGYRFVEWSGAASGSAPSLTIDPATRPTLIAHFAPAPVSTVPVVINEIQYHPPDDNDTGDWIELLNRSAEDIDVSGWTLKDEDDDHAYVLPDGTTIAAKGFLVLGQEPDNFTRVHPDVPILGGWDFGFSQGGDQVRIFDADGILVDSLTFDDEDPWPTEADGDGPTLELIDSAQDNADPANWSFSQVEGGTPGAPNTVGIPVATETQPPLSHAYTLDAAYPNPFRDAVTITYHLPATGQVELRVYNALGQQVRTLVHAEQAAGPQTIRWDAADAAPGLYLLQLRVDGAPRAARTVMRIR